MKVFLSIVVGILCLVLLLVFSWGMGWFGIFYKNTVGVANQNEDRQIFEQTQSYVKGMADDLAKYKYEFDTTKDVTAKKAIIDMIVSRFADFDIEKLNDAGLQRFLRDIRNGNYNELEEK